MARDRLDWVTVHQLRVLAAVARERSFGRAAESLCLSEPTVSDQIKSLERLAEARLLHRSRGRRSVTPTEAGQVLLQCHEEISQALERARTSIDAMHGLERGVVRLGAGFGFGRFVPWLNQTFRQRHPGISLSVGMDLRWRLLESLAQQSLDLAVVLGPMEDAGFASDHLITTEIVAVCPPHHSLLGHVPITFDAFAKESLSVPHEKSLGRTVLERMAAETGVGLNISLETDNIAARLQAVLSGISLGIFGLNSIAPMLLARQLSLLEVQGFPIVAPWFIVHLPSSLSPSAQAFKEHLLQAKHELDAMSTTTAGIEDQVSKE